LLQENWRDHITNIGWSNGNFSSKQSFGGTDYECAVTVFNSSVENRVKKGFASIETPHQHTSYALCTFSVQLAASTSLFARVLTLSPRIVSRMEGCENLFGKNILTKAFAGRR